MFASRILPPAEAHGAGQVIALFRIWRAAMDEGRNPLPALFAALGSTATNAELAPACDSFFALTQACLGRALLAGAAQSSELSPDEQGLLDTLRHVPPPAGGQASAAIPHGLPGALQWAAMAVLRAMDGSALADLAATEGFAGMHDLAGGTVPGACPFVRPDGLVAEPRSRP